MGDDVIPPLVGVLREPNRQQLLQQNICITLGRLGVGCGPQMGKPFAEFAQVWCNVMRGTRFDHEKINAFQGLCNMIKANPQAALGCVPELAAAIASFYPAPQNLQPLFREILFSYKQTLGAQWPAVYGRIPEDAKMRLGHM